MQAQLEEARAADGVLNLPKAALGRDRRRSLVVGEEVHIVVRRVKIGMVEDIESVRLEAEAEAVLDDGNSLAKLISKRTWNGPRNVFLPVVPNTDSQSSQPVASQGGTPSWSGARNCGEKSAAFSTGLPAFTPCVP